MTLTSTTVRATFPGTGTTGPFPYAFRIIAASELVVTTIDAAGAETTLSYPSQYSVSGVGNTSGGSVTLVTALAVGASVVLYRATPRTQTTDIRNGGAFFAETHEAAFDRFAAIDQEQQDHLDRAIRVPATLDPADLDLELSPEVGKALVWQSTTQLGNSAIDSSAIAVPGEGRTVTTATAYLLNNAVYHVNDYLPTSGYVHGTSDARAYIQAALDAAEAAGGGVVQLGKGTYRVSKTTLRIDASIAVCLEVAGKVTLRGVGRSTSTIKVLGATAVTGLNIIFNRYAAAFTDRDIVIEDLTVDGDRTTVAALGTVTAMNAITTTRVTNLTVRRVRVTGLHDTGNAPPNEGFAIAPTFPDGFVIDDCTVDSGASGIGCNGSATIQAKHGRISNTYVTSARAMGFTSYGADDITHVNCHVNTCGTNAQGHGFNCENNRNVRYIGCTVRTTQNGGSGFATHAGSYGTQHIGCTASACTDNGIAYFSTTASTWLDANGQIVGAGFGTGANANLILGGTVTNNTNYGVLHDRGTLRGVLPIMYGNGLADFGQPTPNTNQGESQVLGATGLQIGSGDTLKMARTTDSGVLTILQNSDDSILFRDLGVSGKGWYFRDAGGTDCLRLTDGANVASGLTAVYVRVNDGAVVSLRQVSIGAADSGGAGFRMLRVAN